jgi:flagellar basal-body rod modification protein FlgD
MTTTPTSSTAGIGGVASKLAPTESTAFQGLDKDAFMKLLVAQLRYQNPLSPADGQEFMAQAAQMAMVERLDGLARAQSEAVAYQQVLLSSSLVGKHVGGTPVDGGDPVDGVVTGVRFHNGVPLLKVGDKELPVTGVETITPQ